MKKQGEELAKLKKASVEKPLSFRGHLSKQKDAIKTVFADGKGEVVFNIRAAAIMGTDNAVTGHDELPEDLIESFSIGAFVEKRQDRDAV
jgi:uncharacterized protein YdeI (BOF family)